MAVTRPLKEGSVPTYQQKVALGFPDILASEVDADLDTIYAAWNGGVATANLVDGSVTTPKLSTAPNGVGPTNLNDNAVLRTKVSPGHGVWATTDVTGPGAQLTLTGSAVYMFGTTPTVATGRVCLFLASITPLISRVATGGDRVTIFIEVWIGGTPTGHDGTNVQNASVQASVVSGAAMSLAIPQFCVFTPIAAAALPFKVFAAASDVANYNSFIPANSIGLHVWELP